MTEPLKFPALGSTKVEKLPKPFEGVEIEYRLVRPREYRSWARSLAQLQAQEQVRLSAERASSPDKEALCFSDKYSTSDGEVALADWSREILRPTLVRVSNLIVGDQDLAGAENIDQLLEALDWADLLTMIGLLCFQGQSPTADQKKA